MVLFKLSVTDSNPDENGDIAKAWVAEITGTDPKYKLQREFVKIVKKEGRTKYFELDHPGLYQIKSYSEFAEPKQTYGRLEADGTFTKFSYDALVEAAREAESLDDFVEHTTAIKHKKPFSLLEESKALEDSPF